MTRAEFIQKYQHELCGLIADALSHDRRGGEASMFIRMAFRKVDGMLASMYDQLHAPKAGAGNGGPKPPLKVAQGE